MWKAFTASSWVNYVLEVSIIGRRHFQVEISQCVTIIREYSYLEASTTSLGPY